MRLKYKTLHLPIFHELFMDFFISGLKSWRPHTLYAVCQKQIQAQNFNLIQVLKIGILVSFYGH